MATFDLATLRTITLLFVEDEIKIREQSSKVYSKLFHKVYAAKDGQEAFDIFLKKQDHIDVVVTDINMPKLSGIDLAKKIEKISNVPFIITSAYTDTQHLLDAIGLGIKKYIIKPITLNNIVQDIEEIVVEHRTDSKIKDVAKTLLLQSKQNNTLLTSLQLENNKLKKSLSFYKNLANNYILMLTIDKKGNILNISNRLSKSLLYTEDELIGENISIFQDKSSKTISFQKQMLEAIHKKTSIDVQHNILAKNGKSFKYIVSMHLFYGEDNLVAGYNLYLSQPDFRKE